MLEAVPDNVAVIILAEKSPLPYLKTNIFAVFVDNAYIVAEYA